MCLHVFHKHDQNPYIHKGMQSRSVCPARQVGHKSEGRQACGKCQESIVGCSSDTTDTHETAYST